MSPLQAMERSYSVLKQVLRDGRLAPGARLEANRIAGDLGVSMTPVRDVLHRLVGERLVEASSGEGFHVPRYSEADLRDLYEWHSALISIALRTARAPLVQSEADTFSSLADRADRLFERLAAFAPNREIHAAVANVSDRLHPFRLVEPDVLGASPDELHEIESADAVIQQAIRRYHLRRMKFVSELIRRREHAGSST